MKKPAILFGGLLASVSCAHADLLPVPGPLDIVLILFVLAAVVLVCAGVVFVLYKICMHLRPGQKIAEKKKMPAKTKAAKKN